MERKTPHRNTKNVSLWPWGSGCALIVVSAMAWTNYEEEAARLDGLRTHERQKEQAYAALERTRAQADRYVDRFSRDAEFVRDQARERLGVAELGEIVIRLDGARSMATPANPAPQPTTGANR